MENTIFKGHLNISVEFEKYDSRGILSVPKGIKDKLNFVVPTEIASNLKNYKLGFDESYFNTSRGSRVSKRIGIDLFGGDIKKGDYIDINLFKQKGYAVIGKNGTYAKIPIEVLNEIFSISSDPNVEKIKVGDPVFVSSSDPLSFMVDTNEMFYVLKAMDNCIDSDGFVQHVGRVPMYLRNSSGQEIGCYKDVLKATPQQIEEYGRVD